MLNRIGHGRVVPAQALWPIFVLVGASGCPTVEPKVENWPCQSDGDCISGNICDQNAQVCVEAIGVCDDSDADGVCRDVDNCATTANHDQADGDGDGIGDACDSPPGGLGDDADDDGVDDDVDNCPGTQNSDQADEDHDGVGDVCDDCPSDPAKTDPGVCGCGAPDLDNDHDSIVDCGPGSDPGPDLADTDGDGIPNAVDPCPADNPDDTDADGICDSVDVCLGGDDEKDHDHDDVPDHCDLCPGGDDGKDGDGDGIPDHCDRCRSGDDAIDADGDGVADPCDLCPGGDDTTDDDHDHVPDDCDLCLGGDDKKDHDHDGVPDHCDLCKDGDDAQDDDGDGVPDHCDVCPGGDDTQDTDGDGVPDHCDLCPGGDDAQNSDSDGVPDFCDPCPADDPDDSDGDGVCDSDDVCPGRDDAACTDTPTNVVATSTGGVLENCPSQWCPGGINCEPGYWLCENINDGAFADGCAAADHQAAWSSASSPESPQVFTFSFDSNRSALIATIVIQNYGESPCTSESYYSGRVQVYGEPVGGGSTFLILDETLSEDLTRQEFHMMTEYGSIPHVQRLFLHVLNGENDAWELGEFEAWGYYGN